MATDEKEVRNFRSAYYEKVGCRSVEEKKSLEILLKEKPINRIKLKQFCLRFTVPAVHRSILWNLLLGVFPIYHESNHVYVLKQRSEVFHDLIHALKIMKIIDEQKTPKSRIFYAMWLLENKQLSIGFNIYTDSIFHNLCETLLAIFENDVEVYWMAKGFYKLTENIQNEVPKLTDLTYSLLEKEDVVLYKHMESIGVLKQIPLESWYTSGFASLITEPYIIRIWDKICGGSVKILVFCALVLFTTLRRQILRCKDLKSLLDVIENIKEDQEQADLLVNKAIEFWQQNKGHTEYLEKIIK